MPGYSFLPQAVKRLPQLEHHLARHLATTAGRDHDRYLAGGDPAIECRLADTEDLGGTGARKRRSELDFELPSNGGNVWCHPSNPLSAAKADDVVHEA